MSVTKRIAFGAAASWFSRGVSIVLVTAVPPRGYTAANWWQREEGLVAFQNEVIKYAFYRLKY